MRLSCEVDVSSRLLSSHGIRGNSRAAKGCIMIGKSGSGPALLVCTAKDRGGTKYRIHKNVETAFTKFMKEGKATLRLKQPPVDIIISKADAVQLKALMTQLSKISRDGSSAVTLTPLTPASSKQVEGVTKKMVIKSKREYPITSGIPATLESFQASSCNLKKVDSRLLSLRHLGSLTLDQNCIAALPLELGRIPLHTLVLSSNALTKLHYELCSHAWPKSLTHLDLSSNLLTSLPPSFTSLSALVNFNVSSNRLGHLPLALNKLASLRYFTCADNQLEIVPPQFANLRLQSLDLSGNPFTSDTVLLPDNHSAIPSLRELCARAVVDKRVAYSACEVPPQLFDLLAGAVTCPCGRSCFMEGRRFIYRLRLTEVSESVSAVDVSGRMHVPVTGMVCSGRCAERWRAKPGARILPS